MPKVYVYDSYDNKFFRYTLRENDPMPYSTDTTLRVRGVPRVQQEQRALDDHRCHGGVEPDPPHLRQRYPGGYAFKAHLGGGGHGTTSQHYAGVAFDVGSAALPQSAAKFYNDAVRTGAWGYVEPLSMTPTWVHFDRRYGKPACRSTTAGYPTVRRAAAAAPTC